MEISDGQNFVRNEKAGAAGKFLDHTMLTHAQKIAVVRSFYESKGYRVHSGLQFGCELVLYADDPSRVHSDFCVHVIDGTDGSVDWRMVQTLVRSMPDLHKTLVLAHVRVEKNTPGSSGDGNVDRSDNGDDIRNISASNSHRYEVVELAFATEHAPFRHKSVARKTVKVGSQVKSGGKQKRWP